MLITAFRSLTSFEIELDLIKEHCNKTIYPEHTKIEYSDHEWEEGGAIPYKNDITGMLILTSLRVFRTDCQQNVNILIHKGIAWGCVKKKYLY